MNSSFKLKEKYFFPINKNFYENNKLITLDDSWIGLYINFARF